MRAFVALDLPEALLGPITALQAGVPVGRVVPEENLHLTLAFLDEITGTQAADLAEALAGLEAGPIELELRGLDLFGGRRPGVLFVSARGPGLRTLHDKVVRAARQANIKLQHARFRPHVTIARFPRTMQGKDQIRLGEFLALNGTFALPPAKAEVLTLFRSHLRADGVLHQPLAQFELAG